jgi:hypothetical protein
MRTDGVEVRFQIELLCTNSARLIIILVEQETAFFEDVLEARICGIDSFDATLAQQINLTTLCRFLSRCDLGIVLLDLEQVQGHPNARTKVAIDPLAPFLPHLIHLFGEEAHFQRPLREIWDAEEEVKV